MKPLRLFLARFPLVLFFVLAYGISWTTVIPLKGGLFPHGPMLAAMIMIGVTAGRGGISELWQQVTQRRLSRIWFLIAPGIVVIFSLGAFGLNLLLGANVTSTAHLQSWSAVFLLILPLLIFGGMWEEPGWSGFALPRLQARFSWRPAGMLLASLILSILRAGWHLPLVLYGTIPWYDFLFYNSALQFLISWLYNQTGGSLSIVMLFHLASNVMFGIMFPLFTGADQTRYHWLFIGLAWLLVLVTNLSTRTLQEWKAGRSKAEEAPPGNERVLDSGQ